MDSILLDLRRVHRHGVSLLFMRCCTSPYDAVLLAWPQTGAAAVIALGLPLSEPAGPCLPKIRRRPHGWQTPDRWTRDAPSSAPSAGSRAARRPVRRPAPATADGPAQPPRKRPRAMARRVRANGPAPRCGLTPAARGQSGGRTLPRPTAPRGPYGRPRDGSSLSQETGSAADGPAHSRRDSTGGSRGPKQHARRPRDSTDPKTVRTLDKFVQKCTNTLVFSMNYRILQMNYLYNPDS